MTDMATAKKIGYRQAFKASTIGIVAAYLIMAFLAGPFWLFEIGYASNLIFAALALYGAAYLLGGLAGKLIIIKKYSSGLVGLVIGILIIWSATFAGSLIGFFFEGLRNESSISNAVEDYILTPIVIVLVWGFAPIIIISILFGESIRQRANKLTAPNSSLPKATNL